MRKQSLLSLAFVVLIVVPSPAKAAIFNGAPAIDLLGQYDDSLSDPQPIYTKSAANDGPNKLGLSLATTSPLIDTTNHRLFVADTSNNRVLVYTLNTDNTIPNRIPDSVLGQANYYTSTASTSQTGMSAPRGFAYDAANQRLFVAQSGNNRVTVYDVTSITDGESAVNVLGQGGFTASSATNTQAGMNFPIGLAYDSANNRLFVAQTNHRVTVYDVTSITDGESAVNVLGQSDFTSFGAANTQAGMNNPSGIAYDSTNQRLFVTQNVANRVTIFNVSSIADGQNAVNVLGQSTFTNFSAANTQAGMNLPVGIAYDSANQRLFVSQAGNNRVTVYDLTSITDGESAVNVLGQSDFTSVTPANTQAGMNSPIGLTYDSTNQRLFAAQNGSHRITVYDVASITDGENAVDLIGQYDDSTSNPQPVYTKSVANNGPNKLGFSLGNSLSSPLVDTTNHRLFVSDPSNNRVLVYSLSDDNTLTDRIPDFVLGQSNFYSNTAATTQSGLGFPEGLAYDTSNQRLFIADINNSRVTVYSGSTLSTGMNASLVIGQADFTSATVANTQAGMNAPVGIAYDSTNQRLFVVQQGANRVTVYTGSTLSNGMNAAKVLGQADFTSFSAANTQTGLNQPWGIAYDSTNQRLFVAQQIAHRVTVFNLTSGIANGMNASNVLGQSTFTSVTAANSQTGMNGPTSVAYDSTNHRLFVGERAVNRVKVFNVSSITDGQNAVNVLGQSTFTSITAANTQAGMNQPRGVGYDSSTQRLYVPQSGNNRLSVFDVAPLVLTGAVYTDRGVTSIGSGKHIAVYANGVLVGTGSTNGSSQYSVSAPNIGMTGGTLFTLFLDGESEKGVTVAVGTGALGGVPTYQNHLIAQARIPLTNINLRGARTSDSDVSALYTASGNTILVASNKTLFIPSQTLYKPGSADTLAQGPIIIDGRVSMSTARILSSASGVTINGTLTMVASAQLRLSGSLLKASGGTFTPSTSTVTLNGTNQTLSGSTTFYNLTKTITSAATFTFAATTTQTISNTLTLQGAASNLLSLRSSLTGVQWKIDPQGTRTISYLDVKDSNNIDSTVLSCLTGCTDSGNNTNWILSTASSASTSAGGGGNAQWLINLRQQNNLDFYGRTLSSSSSSVTVSGGTGAPDNSPSVGAAAEGGEGSSSSSSSASSVPDVPPLSPHRRFRDVPIDVWFFAFVKELAAAGIIEGYKDAAGRPTGRFGPAGHVTHAEILKMSLLAGGGKPADGPPDNLSARGDWSAPYVKAAEDMGLSVFTPDLDVRRPATRGQVVQTVLEAFGLEIVAGPAPFSDLDPSSRFAPAISTAYRLGILSGDDGKTTVRPDEPVNRAEAAAMIVRMLDVMRQR